ncbi:troponin T, skeletal muscle-like isoform X7 [Ostrea edulis]|uniref:troponin T, skeletal muscle-like isoform X7 n=1 Tax=Ostrea edulis TaxID=37623 RepID=UPI0024AED5C5|nr:troponin T, skeletal muscle-like isoform X7 [Ostrea edulis]XP_055996887.1 troponin T, skeletal muscle-like isoform X7 [Ostrea edulis]XP_055996888.1 troponin T, skeletal muscle-like isoform X7 [Ostrea edulis]
MSDDESHNPPASQENEAKRAMEEAARRKAEKVAQEIAEFEEQRKEEREKEQQEIQELREKREQRKREREEDEKRLAGMRAQEEARRKAEEEEKKRKKMEEEQKRKEDRERKRKEQEERIKNMRTPNFVITKHSDGERPQTTEENEREEVQKSKEQLEAEKRSFLSQRIKPLPDLSGLDVEKLAEQAKDLHKEIFRLMTEKYDIEEKFKRQQYDMIELAERARQMSKGKGRKGLSSAQVDESFDRLADKFAGAPPKIQLCSKYERHTDHRSYGQRLELFEDLSKPIETVLQPKKDGDGEEDAGQEEGGEEGGEE